METFGDASRSPSTAWASRTDSFRSRAGSGRGGGSRRRVDGWHRGARAVAGVRGHIEPCRSSVVGDTATCRSERRPPKARVRRRSARSWPSTRAPWLGTRRAAPASGTCRSAPPTSAAAASAAASICHPPIPHRRHSVPPSTDPPTRAPRPCYSAARGIVSPTRHRTTRWCRSRTNAGPARAEPVAPEPHASRPNAQTAPCRPRPSVPQRGLRPQPNGGAPLASARGLANALAALAPGFHGPRVSPAFVQPRRFSLALVSQGIRRNSLADRASVGE